MYIHACNLLPPQLHPPKWRCLPWTRPYPIFEDQPMGFPSPWDSWMAKCPGGPDQSIATIVILPDEVPWAKRESRDRFFKKRGVM